MTEVTLDATNSGSLFRESISPWRITTGDVQVDNSNSAGKAVGALATFDVSGVLDSIGLENLFAVGLRGQIMQSGTDPSYAQFRIQGMGNDLSNQLPPYATGTWTDTNALAAITTGYEYAPRTGGYTTFPGNKAANTFHDFAIEDPATLIANIKTARASSAKLFTLMVLDRSFYSTDLGDGPLKLWSNLDVGKTPMQLVLKYKDPAQKTPYELVYSALWSMLEANAEFVTLVPLSNRIKYSNSLNPSGTIDIDTVSTHDLPRVRIAIMGSEPHTLRTSNSSTTVERFEVQVFVGEQMLPTTHYPLKWAVFNALKNWQAALSSLTWRNKTFVRITKPTAVTEPPIDDRGAGIKGWAALWSIEALLVFDNADLTN